MSRPERGAMSARARLRDWALGGTWWVVLVFRGGDGGRERRERRNTFLHVCGFYEFLELALGCGEEFVGGVGVAC